LPKIKVSIPQIALDDLVNALVRQELHMRQWVDNTGIYHTRARLIAIQTGHVRLLKHTGKTTTVPMRRLSVTDRAYVDRVAADFGYSEIGRLAIR
jgi:hypothetical protein